MGKLRRTIDREERQEKKEAEYQDSWDSLRRVLPQRKRK